MQTFAWQGFELQHPDGWECVRFSKNRARGECALADPTGRRMSVCWSAVRGAVDSKRILQEAVQQLEKSDPKGKLASREWKGPERWSGFQWNGSECLTVALSYFAEAGYLLQTQFFSDRKMDEPLERRVLASVRYQKAGSLWHWKAFGCRVALSSQFEIDGCEIFPGRASLSFNVPGRKGQKLKIDRLAVPESHLKGRSLKNWFCSTLNDSRRVISAADAELRGHACLNVDLKPTRPTPTQWITRVARRGRAAVWICEHESRLYKAEWEGAASAAPELGNIVECCGHG